MRKAISEKFDVTVPALIVTHGSTKKKRRPLTRDLIVIGRGPGCDIGLVSPEVANVHCVVMRQSTGWIIRDCSGRATRINGQNIVESPLRDGDSIQIGTFSFEAYLPGMSPAAPMIAQSATNARIARLERSRRRFAEKALRLREQVQEHASQARDRERQAGELDRLEQKLRAASQESRARQAELDAYSRHMRKEVARCRDQERELETELVKQRVELLKERQHLQMLQGEMQLRSADAETTASKVADALQAEREALEQERRQVSREREQMIHERAYLEQQRQEVMGRRGVIAESTRDTILDETSDRLASARKLLRELAEKRKT